MLKITELLTEYRNAPVGIDAYKPRFSWKLQSTKKDVKQAAYRVVVTKQDQVVWDTKELNSDQSICIVYDGKKLEAKTRYDISVSVIDNHGECACKKSWFETGLMTGKHMQADWITHGFGDNLEACAVFKKKFFVAEDVKTARLYASALGVYEAELDGKKISDVCLAPGWTCYKDRVQYQTYEIRELHKGEHILSFVVGNGWYKGILGFFNQGNHYGNRTAVIGQLELIYKSGVKQIFTTDESWESTTAEIRYSEWYHGEIIDYTIEEQETKGVSKLDFPKNILVAQQSEPVRITERVCGKECIQTPAGDTVIDFGQNLAGVAEARIKAERGTKIQIRYAEALDENGNLYTGNLRTAKATDVFICSGGEDVFRPRFTSHGFRYIAVDGLGSSLDPGNFTACVWHTDLKRVGYFSCSDPDVNRLWENIDWTMRSNYIDIPTDCPQRDERLGYTGDAQLFLSTAVCFRNTALFFEKWLQDLKCEQAKGNGVPTSVPNIMESSGGISIWHDAAAIVPWTLYETYSDARFLEEQFESMMECVDYTRQMTEEDGLLKKGQQLGDWVALDVSRGPMPRWKDRHWNLELIEKIGATDPYFVANIYYSESARITAEAAKILGKKKEAEYYRKLYQDIVSAIQKEYMTGTGRLISETQTGCALALHFGVIPENNKEKIINTLVEKLRERKNHLTTGFAGTKVLCKALSENGLHDLAGTVFMQKDCPSWLYSVKLGATTIWELWDGVNPDGSFNPYEMNSLNQYAYATIGDWMMRDLCGLDLVEPGYKKSIIRPRLIKGIPELKGCVETVYGTLSCEIFCYDQKYKVTIHIPENTSAIVSLPGRKEETLGSGYYSFTYETEDHFVKERYDRETQFDELLQHPTANKMLHQYAKELMENELFLMFAKERSVLELEGMLPPEAMQLIDLVLEQCNQEEAGSSEK